MSTPKEKKFGAHCRSQTTAGLSNSPSGEWRQNGSWVEANSIRNVMAGSRFGKGKPRKTRRPRGMRHFTIMDNKYGGR